MIKRAKTANTAEKNYTEDIIETTSLGVREEQKDLDCYTPPARRAATAALTTRPQIFTPFLSFHSIIPNRQLHKIHQYN